MPELASRAHQSNIVPVVDSALRDAGVSRNDLDAVAFTRGPGLLGALLVGMSFSKSMALALNIPIIDVNHMQAHILAHFIEDPKPQFPFLCLTVSGGHTQIVLAKDYLDMTVLGETQDDAVGEAFDKSAKLLGLPYPGGPIIDQYAQNGNPEAFVFPDADMPGLDYSFSGIKTAFLYFLRNRQKENPDFIKENMHDICASLQHSLVNMLLKKLIRASRETGVKEIALAGGVSANSGLRKEAAEEAAKRGWRLYAPKPEFCTDNAAMVAMAAHFKYMAGEFSDLSVEPLPRMDF